jgi:hypothetical protein
MEIKAFHLSYCSNIHPGETWAATFQNLKIYIPEVRTRLLQEGPFGIGLRLSHTASLLLEKPENLKEFQDWLEQENAYVFTLNCFPFGDFHRLPVKEKVHFPDWTTRDRRDYTKRAFRILAQLLPDGMEGGISTSPLSYRYWFKTQEKLQSAMESATQHLLEVVVELIQIRQNTGKNLHLDIEPEPDGILENSDEMISFYTDWLLPKGIKYLDDQLGYSPQEAKKAILNHIQVCYDVCHFAIVYEKPADTFAKFAAHGIKIGKIQISAALKILMPPELAKRVTMNRNLKPFAESTYLHQVIGRTGNGALTKYSDLPQALEKLVETTDQEWRIHFHVPVFLENYGSFSSTQTEILTVFEELKANPSITQHLEVETYTWEVLPEDISLSLGESISRELGWVIKNLT